LAKGRGRGAGGPRGGPGRSRRPGRRERGARSDAGQRAGRRAARPKVGRDLEGLVVAAEAPTSAGQALEVETREGDHYHVQCLGEPVEVGARIAFVPDTRTQARAPRGVLTRLLAAERAQWIARVARAGRGGHLVLLPFAGVDAPRFALHERDAKNAQPGDRVRIVPLGHGGKRENRKVVSRGRRHRGHPGVGRGELPVKVIEVLGPAGHPDADHQALAWKHRLPAKFSRRALIEAEALDPAALPKEATRRRDLRALPFVTIDPASAKDHDDAVFAEEAPAKPELHAVGGSKPRDRSPAWTRRLWVAIADVSHFVAERSFLDADARRRGNSFYFPDRALPMLPERLSSDLCSLRPDVDRRAIVVELRLDAAGQVVDAVFHEAWIRSHARLSYEEAAEWLARSGTSDDPEPAWGPSLRCLAEIADALSRARREAGGLELVLPEVEYVVDDEGRAVDARVRDRNPAHGLIEEAMLAANRAVARALVRADRPTLHRGHAPPAPRKLDAFAELLERHGIDPPDDLEVPGALARVLDEAQGAPFEERLHEAALRSMSQARYEPESKGHYALRFDHYLHFTSPIRRYADLEVHRALRRLIRGEPAPPDSGGAADLAAWLSGRERVAQEAERDAQALAACALMAGREGETFSARITGASEFGVFVRVEAPAVTGLVPMRALDGRWDYDESEDAIVQAGGRARLETGASIRVRLSEVDPDRARLAFGISGRLAADEGRGRRRAR